MIRWLPVMTVLLIVGLVSHSAQQPQRLPLQKKKIELKSPSSWSKSVRVDPQTKKEVPYDPRPRIEVADARAGKYSLKWIGYDGREKVIIYQRPDCVDVVVTASMTPSSGTFAYEYVVQNLATSGDYLNGFAVQNFSSTIAPKRPSTINNVFIGNMSPGIFSKEGNWIRFAPLPPHPKVQPGQTLRLKLYSSSLPGLVMCRADGGNRGMKGVGEDVPGELEASLDILGYEAWPSGYTIGPVDSLKGISQQEKIAYLLKVIPTFKQQGWLIPQISLSYEQLLKRNDLQGLLKRIASDLKVGSITSEVFAIVEAMKN